MSHHKVGHNIGNKTVASGLDSKTPLFRQVKFNEPQMMDASFVSVLTLSSTHENQAQLFFASCLKGRHCSI